MGVSGCGKTTIARLLSQKLNYEFLEADEFHPIENIERMSRGEPLNDEDRRPWLEKIARALKENEEKGAVLACSALKESYRNILQNGLKKPINVFLLEGSFEEISERMSKRKNHFMPESLLKNQFETLEIPKQAIRINIEKPPSEIVEIILKKVNFIAK